MIKPSIFVVTTLSERFSDTALGNNPAWWASQIAENHPSAQTVYLGFADDESYEGTYEKVLDGHYKQYLNFNLVLTLNGSVVDSRPRSYTHKWQEKPTSKVSVSGCVGVEQL